MWRCCRPRCAACGLARNHPAFTLRTSAALRAPRAATNMGGSRAQLEVERTLRRLVEFGKREAEERAALAQGLCSGAMMPP